MSFVTKEWKDRLAEFAGRRKLTNVSTGEETTVDVSRAEGEVSQEGHAFSAANMNDLEQRIKDGFDKVDADLRDIPKTQFDGLSADRYQNINIGITNAAIGYDGLLVVSVLVKGWGSYQVLINDIPWTSIMCGTSSSSTVNGVMRVDSVRVKSTDVIRHVSNDSDFTVDISRVYTEK